MEWLIITIGVVIALLIVTETAAIEKRLKRIADLLEILINQGNRPRR